jgi:hypothetical protein
MSRTALWTMNDRPAVESRTPSQIALLQSRGAIPVEALDAVLRIAGSGENGFFSNPLNAIPKYAVWLLIIPERLGHWAPSLFK